MTRRRDAGRRSRPWFRLSGLFLVAVQALAWTAGDASAQITYTRGQNVAPSFEGWMPNADGTFDIYFGYFNRNFEEHLHVPIGPENNVQPGGPDRGQPTYFYPRRNLNIFTVTVPADFGDGEVVWTLTSNGKTERAHAKLYPEFILDQRIIFRQHTGFDVQGELEHNQIPTIDIEGDARRTAVVGQALQLAAMATDDGIPEAKPAVGGPFRGSAHGLRVAWHVYRGDGASVSFDPAQFKHYPDFKGGSPWTRGWEAPALATDNRYPVQVTFNEPGTFVLRALAHDGGAASSDEVTVTVSPSAP